MSKPRYLITNLVYGDIYARLFLGNHLKSLLDETNLPALAEKYDIEYMIFTDQQTVRMLASHPNALKLKNLLEANGGKVTSFIFKWPDDKLNKFGHRYSLLLNMFHESVLHALADQELYDKYRPPPPQDIKKKERRIVDWTPFDVLTCWVADLVVAKEFFPRITKRIEEGHGAVFVLPLRAAAEPMANHMLSRPDAFPDKELCALGIECLHHLWDSCHWNNPRFSKLPFCLLWNTVGGIMARTFSTTPIIFKPKKEMLETRGMIDGDIPALCENPYWCTDWTDAPVIGVEPLVCYHPSAANRPASIQLMKDWIVNVHQSQVQFLEKRCFYPDEKSVMAPPDMLKESDNVVKEILEGY